MTAHALPLWLELVAMGFMGAVGAAVARSRGAHVLGTVVAGIVVGLGGGMLRDVLLNTLPVAIGHWQFIPVIALAAVLGALAQRLLTADHRTFIAIQGLALGLLVCIGCQRALDVGVPFPAVIVLGVVTATAGGVMLDAMTATKASVLGHKHVFVSVLVVGAVAFWALSVYVSFAVACVATVALVAALRVMADVLNWRSPMWPGTETEDGA